MKKFTMFLLGVVLVFDLVSHAPADIKVVDIDIKEDPLSNINPAFWTGEDHNFSTWKELNNANPGTEEAWLEALLGRTIDVSLLGRVEASNAITGLGGDDKGVQNYNPNFSWDYAVVKFGNYWGAWQDNDPDDLLTTGPLDKGISHITFFSGVAAVPEPATMLLMGCGLVGLGVFGRKKFLKSA